MKWRIAALSLMCIIGIAIIVNALPKSSPVTLISENFEGKFPPEGWQVIALGNPGGVWARNDYWEMPNYAGKGYCACADSGNFKYDMATELRTPVINLKGYKKATLTFDMDFRCDNTVNIFNRGHAMLIIYVNGKKEIVKEWSHNYHGKVKVDLTPYVGKEIVIAWRYYGDYIYWMEIDNVKVVAEK